MAMATESDDVLWNLDARFTFLSHGYVEDSY